MKTVGKDFSTMEKCVILQTKWRVINQSQRRDDLVQRRQKTASSILTVCILMKVRKIANLISNALAEKYQSIVVPRRAFFIHQNKRASLTHSMIARNQRGLKNCARERPMDSTRIPDTDARISWNVCMEIRFSLTSAPKVKCSMSTEEPARFHRQRNAGTNLTRPNVQASAWDFTQIVRLNLLAAATFIATMERKRRWIVKQGNFSTVKAALTKDFTRARTLTPIPATQNLTVTTKTTTWTVGPTSTARQTENTHFCVKMVKLLMATNAFWKDTLNLVRRTLIAPVKAMAITRILSQLALNIIIVKKATKFRWEFRFLNVFLNKFGA
jgi:hypothetical protein